MRLVVDGFGKFVGCKGETIVIKEEGKTIARLQPAELEQVIISGKGTISTDALRLLAEHGVDVLIVNLRGDVLAVLMPPMMKTVSTRREQYLAYMDKRGVKIGKELIKAKVKNQRAVLYTLAKRRVDTQPQIAEKLYAAAEELGRLLEKITDVDGSSIEEVREVLLNLEGRAAQHYWSALAEILGSLGFSGRSGRYASDPVNSMLNYGYGILLGEVWRAVHYAGLDPYGGFLHADKPGKPSLVLDLMEEFRPHVVDKFVVKLVTRKMVTPEGFEIVNGICQMKDHTRRLFLQEFLSELSTDVRFGDNRLSWSEVMLHQARLLAKFLRGEHTTYEGFVQYW